jgi:hypothetical protein
LVILALSKEPLFIGVRRMDAERFESKIRHLNQEEILTGAISSLNRLLVDKGLIKEDEVQNYFLNWLNQHKLEKAASGRKKKVRRSNGPTN